MYHTTLINITDKKKTKKRSYFKKKKHQIQTKFEMQRKDFWERQFTGTYR